MMVKVTVWRCSKHGEMELVDWEGDTAYCPTCGEKMEKVGEYEE